MHKASELSLGKFQSATLQLQLQQGKSPIFTSIRGFIVRVGFEVESLAFRCALGEGTVTRCTLRLENMAIPHGAGDDFAPEAHLAHLCWPLFYVSGVRFATRTITFNLGGRLGRWIERW